ncbi:uncharacterized protein ACMZJ9_013009 [Mantella aurantiaca]
MDRKIVIIWLAICLYHSTLQTEPEEHSGDEMEWEKSEDNGSSTIVSPIMTMDLEGVQEKYDRRRKVRIIPENSRIPKTYRWNRQGNMPYEVFFSFGRLNPNSLLDRTASQQDLPDIVPEALQSFVDATIFMNETGYWLGEEANLTNYTETKGTKYGVFNEQLKEGEYVFVCGIYWHEQGNLEHGPRILTLRHGKESVGSTREFQMKHQRGDNFLIGVMSQGYQSYREVIGYWTCGTPDLDIGEIRLVDVSPEQLKPCMGDASNFTQKHSSLEKGKPLQIDLGSSQTLATNVRYAFATWQFNISQWLIKTYYPVCTEHTKNQVQSLHQWLTPRNTQRRSGRLFLKSNRERREVFNTILGGIGAGMGVINEVDISVLRSKLSTIASDSKQGFDTQREINDILNNIQQNHVNTQVKVAEDFINHFRRLVDGVRVRGKKVSWALACTQGQAELSTNIKLIVQSIYEGRWPYELASQLGNILPRHITFTNSKWWSNAWRGCTNSNCESCYASSLIPYTESHIGAVYSVISIGLLTGESTLLHPRLKYQNVVRDDGRWRQVDISLCKQYDHDILCMPGQYEIVKEKCWEDASVCVLDGEIIAKNETPVYYLGHRRVCFFILKNTNMTLVMEQGCSLGRTVIRGAWCTLGNVSEIHTQEWSYVVPSSTNLSVNINYMNPVNLGALDLGMGSELQDWLADWEGDENLLRKLQQERANATIVIYHDQNKIKEVVHQLENDASGYWWEVIFGHSSKANGVLNFLIHPIVVLLILAVVLSLVQMYMCCLTRHLYKNISYLSMKIEGQTVNISSVQSECLAPVVNYKIPLVCTNCDREGHTKQTCLIPDRCYKEGLVGLV